MQNAECTMQNVELRDVCNEVQFVGADVLGVPINAKCKIETKNLIHRHHANPYCSTPLAFGNPVAVPLPQKGR